MRNTDWLQSDVIHHASWSAQFCQDADTQAAIQPDYRKLTGLLIDTESALKHDQTTTVAKLSVAAQDIVLKRYNARSRGHKFKRAFRMSRARRCWKMSYAFARAGLNVAPPILMYEHRFGPIRLNAFFASHYLQGDELLTALPGMEKDEAQSVVAAIDSAFSKMRACRLTHGDMKASNLLWVNGQLFFIDLDAAQQHRSQVSWRAKHAKDRKRFLKNWQSKPELLALFSHL